MSDLDADELLPSERMRTQALEGDVTQIHRGHRYADEGDTFAIDGTTFEVTAVRQRTLGALSDEDAQAEGMDDLEGYRRVLERVHENFEWDDDSDVVLHQFERQGEAPARFSRSGSDCRRRTGVDESIGSTASRRAGKPTDAARGAPPASVAVARGERAERRIESRRGVSPDSPARPRSGPVPAR